MLLSREEARAFVRTMIGKFPELDPIDVAYEMGRMSGHENAAWLVSKGLSSVRDEEIDRDFVRHMLSHVCDIADEGAMKFVPPGMAVPSRESRMAERTWL